MDAGIGTPCLNGIVFIIDRLFSVACAPVRMGISLTFGAQWVLWYKTFSKHFKLLKDPHAGLSRTIKVLFLISCILFHYFGFFFERVDDRVLNIFREFLALFSYLYQDFIARLLVSWCAVSLIGRNFYSNFDSLGDCYNSLGANSGREQGTKMWFMIRRGEEKKQFEFKGSLLSLKQSKLKWHFTC